MRVDQTVTARNATPVTWATRHDETAMPRSPSFGLSGRVDSDQEHRRSTELGAAVHARWAGGRRQFELQVVAGGDRRRRLDFEQRGRVAQGQRDALRQRHFIDRDRYVGAAAATVLRGVFAVVIALAVMLAGTCIDRFARVIAAGAAGVHELDATLAVRPAADDQGARQDATRHQQHCPDEQMAGVA